MPFPSLPPIGAPTAQFLLGLTRGPATAIAAQNGIPSEHLDAFQHAFASAELTRTYGETPARYAGELNEFLREDNITEDRNMDLWNNSVGREIGKTSSSQQEVIEKIKEALLPGPNGVTPLVTDFNNDPRVQPQNFPNELLPFYDPNPPLINHYLLFLLAFL